MDDLPANASRLSRAKPALANAALRVRIMLWQPKSDDGFGQRCLVSLVEGLHASHPGCNAAVRGRFPMQRIKPALTESLNERSPTNTAPTLLQEKVAVNGCKLRRLPETTCRHFGAAQSVRPAVGYRTQSTCRGRV